MKKILTILTSLGLTTVATTSVVSCWGDKPSQPINEIDLKDLHLVATISGVERMTDTDAFNTFIQANPNVLDLRENVNFGGFKKPEYQTNGSLTITAKPNTKYTGSMTVTITAIGQQALSGLGLNLNLDSTYDNEQTAFDAFIQANANVTDLKDNVTHSDFVPSDYGTPGSLKISATPNGKYSGSATVRFKPLTATSLNDLPDLILSITSTEDIIADTTGAKAFAEFLAENEEKYPDLEGNVEQGTFDPPTGIQGDLIGTLVITGIHKYKDTIRISVPLPKVQEDQDIVDTILNNSSTITFIGRLEKNETLSAFIERMRGGNGTNASHWFLHSEIDQYAGDKEGQFPILAKINYDKYKLIGIYLADEKTELTDAYIKQNYKQDGALDLETKFDYGSVLNQFCKFTLYMD